MDRIDHSTKSSKKPVFCICFFLLYLSFSNALHGIHYTVCHSDYYTTYTIFSSLQIIESSLCVFFSLLLILCFNIFHWKRNRGVAFIYHKCWGDNKICLTSFKCICNGCIFNNGIHFPFTQFIWITTMHNDRINRSTFVATDWRRKKPDQISIWSIQ